MDNLDLHSLLYRGYRPACGARVRQVFPIQLAINGATMVEAPMLHATVLRVGWRRTYSKALMAEN
ncbi:hypothetical protein RSgd_2465 [Ralstonia solanacearum]